MQATFHGYEQQQASVQSFFCTHPFQNQSQKNNFFTIATTANWSVLPTLQARGYTQTDLETIAQAYSSLGPTTTQRPYFQFVATHWQTNWIPSTNMQAVLNYVAIAIPELKDPLSKCWQLRASKQEQFITSYQCYAELPRPTITVPEINATFEYQYSPTNWIPRIVQHPVTPAAYKQSWGLPTGTTYNRSWKPTNSWQICFSYQGTTLKRTASFSPQASYVQGEIQAENFVEHIIIDTAMP